MTQHRARAHGARPISIAATAVLVASIQVLVQPVEEPYLARAHGATYGAYAARVGRFVPRLGLVRVPPR